MKNNTFIYSLSLILFIAGLFSAIQTARTGSGTDFYLVWAVNRYGNMVHPGKLGNIFSEESKKTISSQITKMANQTKEPELLSASSSRPDLNLCASPFFFSVMKLFTRDTYGADRFLFALLSITCILLGIYLFGTMFSFNIFRLLLFSGAVLLSFYPLELSLSLGNINEIMLIFAVLFQWVLYNTDFHFKHFTAGLLMGLMLLFKPVFIFSALLLVFYLCIKNIKKGLFFISGGLVSILLSIAFSSVYFDLMPAWSGWLAYLNRLDLKYWSESFIFGNFSFTAAVYYLFHADIRWGLYICIGLSGFGLLYWSRNVKTANDNLYQLLLFWSGFYFFQLVSPLVWYHYFTLNIIPLLLLLIINDRIEQKHGDTGEIKRPKICLANNFVFPLTWIMTGMPYIFESIGVSSQTVLCLSSHLILTLFYITVFLSFSVLQKYKSL